jgi:hypothetical protein
MHQRAYKNGSLIGQRISLVYATLHTTYGAGVSSVLSLWGSILYAVPTDHLTHYILVTHAFLTATSRPQESFNFLLLLIMASRFKIALMMGTLIFTTAETANAAGGRNQSNSSAAALSDRGRRTKNQNVLEGSFLIRLLLRRTPSGRRRVTVLLPSRQRSAH